MAKSRGHLHIGNLLSQLNFKAVEEYSVQKVDPTSKIRGWYDWVLLDIKVVIEIQGAQHEIATSYTGDVEEAVSNLWNNRLRDRAKQLAADNAGWGYLAIPYKQCLSMTLAELTELVSNSINTSA